MASGRAGGHGPANERRFSDPVANTIHTLCTLRRAGLSLGHVRLLRPDGSGSSLASGSDGENLIRAEDATQAKAWRLATDKVWALGILGR